MMETEIKIRANNAKPSNSDSAKNTRNHSRPRFEIIKKHHKTKRSKKINNTIPGNNSLSVRRNFFPNL